MDLEHRKTFNNRVIMVIPLTLRSSIFHQLRWVEVSLEGYREADSCNSSWSGLQSLPDVCLRLVSLFPPFLVLNKKGKALLEESLSTAWERSWWYDQDLFPRPRWLFLSQARWMLAPCWPSVWSPPQHTESCVQKSSCAWVLLRCLPPPEALSKFKSPFLSFFKTRPLPLFHKAIPDH